LPFDKKTSIIPIEKKVFYSRERGEEKLKYARGKRRGRLQASVGEGVPEQGRDLMQLKREVKWRIGGFFPRPQENSFPKKGGFIGQRGVLRPFPWGGEKDLKKSGTQKGDVAGKIL